MNILQKQISEIKAQAMELKKARLARRNKISKITGLNPAKVYKEIGSAYLKVGSYLIRAISMYDSATDKADCGWAIIHEEENCSPTGGCPPRLPVDYDKFFAALEQAMKLNPRVAGLRTKKTAKTPAQILKATDNLWPTKKIQAIARKYAKKKK